MYLFIYLFFGVFLLLCVCLSVLLRARQCLCVSFRLFCSLSDLDDESFALELFDFDVSDVDLLGFISNPSPFPTDGIVSPLTVGSGIPA